MNSLDYNIMRIKNTDQLHLHRQIEFYQLPCILILIALLLNDTMMYCFSACHERREYFCGKHLTRSVHH